MIWVAKQKYTNQIKRFMRAQAKHMSNVKADDKLAELGGEKGILLKTFHEYDLVAMGIPMNARPVAGVPYYGKHGYTFKSSTGAVL